MAIVINPFMNQASGSVGRILVYKKYYDKTVVSKMPDMSKRVLSKKQLEANERMRLANLYAKYNYKTEERRIEARVRLNLPAHKSLYHALVKEHLDKYMYMPVQQVEDELMKEIQ